METTRSLLFPLILSLALIYQGCAFTDVQSILTKPVKPGSVFVTGMDDSIESKKMVGIIYSDLEKRGFTRSDYLNAEVMVAFSWGDLGPETISWPSSTTTMSSQPNSYTGMYDMTTQSSTQSLTLHKHEFRIQFHDGDKIRNSQRDSLLWEAVGNNTALLSSDISSAAPDMIKSTLDKLNKDEGLGSGGNNETSEIAQRKSLSDDKSIIALEHAVDNNPKDPEAYRTLALKLINVGRIKEAIKYMEDGLRVAPNHIKLRVGLGGIYLIPNTNFHNFEKGTSYIKKAIDLDPAHPSSYAGRGMLADYMEGNGRKAVINLIKAEQLFLKEKDYEALSATRDLLRDLYKKYNLQPEDFKEVSVDDDLKK